MLNAYKVTKAFLQELDPAQNRAAEAPACKMTGKETAWPCSAAGCPLLGDCLTAHQKANAEFKGKPGATSNEEWLKSITKDELAATIHAFHLGYAPWCDHHCENECDDGCDNCILAWLDKPATETEEQK